MKRPVKERPIFPGKNPVNRIYDERGVSPVIAVILMVAITVVLASVLYVMVIGIVGPQKKTITLSMSWEETYDDPGTYSGSVISIMGEAPNINKVTMVILDGKIPGSIKLNELKSQGNFTVGTITANYYDVNNNEKLGAEDIIILSGVTQGDSIKLTHDDAGSMASETF